MKLVTPVRSKFVPVVVLGVALFIGSAFVSTKRAVVVRQPSIAMFTLPASNSVVDLEAYRQSFNRWEKRGGNTRTRSAGSGTTDVTIEAYPWAHASGPKHVPPAGRALLVGHLVNHGTLTTTMYSLKPGSVAEYFLFATNVNGEAGWEMREVSNEASGTMPVRARGMYVGCGHPPAKSSEADFKSCANAAMKHDLKLASSMGFVGIIQEWMSSNARKSAFLDDPAWISCDAGCCTLNAI